MNNLTMFWVVFALTIKLLAAGWNMPYPQITCIFF